MKLYAAEACVEYKKTYGRSSGNLQYTGVCWGGKQNMAESEVLICILEFHL